MNNIKVLCLKKQILPKKTIKEVIKGEGIKKRRIVDLEKLNLILIETSFKKSAIIIIQINNTYLYSETFDKFYKNLNNKDRINLKNNSIFSDKHLVITTNVGKYVIGDWGKVKIIPYE